MVDLEFTVEDGRLWLLQTRPAMRSPVAVFRAAVDMAEDPDFPLDRAEAVERCRDQLDDPPQIAGLVSRSDTEPNIDGPTSQADADIVIATGLAASPGRAIGVLSLDPDDALERRERGEAVILVRRETSPADIHGIGASAGLVTTLGGLVSHAAVVARSWGLAAVVGCADLELTDDAMIGGPHRLKPGDPLTVCGDSGRVLLGRRPATTRPLPEVEIIAAWARSIDTADEVPASNSPPDSNSLPKSNDVLRLIVLRGMVAAAGLVEPLDTSEAAIAAVMADLEQQAQISALPGDRYRATPEGTARVHELYAAEATVRARCNDVLEGAFHGPNLRLKELMTAWQLKTVDGEQVPNDHDDRGYDDAILEQVHNDVHASITPILADLARTLPRLARYQRRLDSSLQRLADGDDRYLTHPLVDSYHTVWFELHEELIRLAGRDRKSEAEAGRA
jgi:pyruvate,orthophosphate dikinase